MHMRKTVPHNQPTKQEETMLLIENKRIAQKIMEAPKKVNCGPPVFYELMDISKHTSPRDARLEREFF